MELFYTENYFFQTTDFTDFTEQCSHNYWDASILLIQIVLRCGKSVII